MKPSTFLFPLLAALSAAAPTSRSLNDQNHDVGGPVIFFVGCETEGRRLWRPEEERCLDFVGRLRGIKELAAASSDEKKRRVKPLTLWVGELKWPKGKKWSTAVVKEGQALPERPNDVMVLVDVWKRSSRKDEMLEEIAKAVAGNVTTMAVDGEKGSLRGSHQDRGILDMLRSEHPVLRNGVVFPGLGTEDIVPREAARQDCGGRIGGGKGHCGEIKVDEDGIVG